MIQFILIKFQSFIDEIFKADDSKSIMRLFSGQAIFLKFWTFPLVNPIYKVTNLVGGKSGISGTTIGGYNIGINNNIIDEHKEYAIEAFKFITSKETQKKHLIQSHTVSAIDSLYDDEDVCKTMDCELIKNVQSFFHKYDDYYYDEFKDYMYDFLYGNDTAEETVKKINEINKISVISSNPSETIEGFIVMILIIVLIGIMVSSLCLLFVSKYKTYFKFLSNDLWLMNILGSIIMLLSVFTEYGERTSNKCKFKYILLSEGFSLTLFPIIYQLLISLFQKNKKVEWIKNHKFTSLMVPIFIEIFFNLLLYISNFNIDEYMNTTGHNYKYCKMKSIFGRLTLFLLLLGKFFMMLFCELLMFFEGSIAKFEIKVLNSYFFINFMFSVLLLVVYSLDFKSHISKFVLFSFLSILMSLNNYLFIFGYSAYGIIRKEDDNILKNTSKSSNNSKCNNGIESENGSRSGNVEIKQKSLILKMIECHFDDGRSNESRIENTDFEDAQSKVQITTQPYYSKELNTNIVYQH